MQTYETLLITSPNLPEEEEKTAVEALHAVITEGGGTVHAHDRMGRRHLAYPIQKFDDGVFIRFLYDSESEVPKELERRSRLSDKVLRSLTVRLTNEWAEDAKKQAVIDAQRKVEAAAQAILDAEAKAAAEAEAAAKAAEAPADAEPATESAATDDSTPGPAAGASTVVPPAKDTAKDAAKDGPRASGESAGGGSED